MSSTEWPLWPDVKAEAQASKLIGASIAAAVEDANYKSALLAVIEDFKRRSGYYPFRGEQGIRYFNPPGPGQRGGGQQLFLGAGLISVNSIHVGLTATDQVGRLVTLRTDYYLRPTNAPSEGEPYRSVLFRSAQYGDPESIKIDGVWGFSLTIPDHVRMAIIRKTLADMSPQFALAITQGQASYKEGDEEYRFASGRDSGAFVSERTAWTDNYEEVLGNIQKMSL